ncbi:hypothetical protein M3231_14940 [Neobacillus mesonae]|nr:hypothetical protein [Neobacillus mesonae]
MNKSYEVEYCNLELRFSRLRIQQLIKDLIQEGYSLYWSEDENFFILSVRTGRKLVKLKFQQMRTGDYKLIGDYIIKDVKLAEYIEKLIGDTRGHAVVRRFKDHIIVVENILFGEVIRLVEVSGFKQRVIYQKGPTPTLEEMEEMLASEEGELRMLLLRMEIDDELERLHAAIGAKDEAKADTCRSNLIQLQDRMLMLEW